MPDFKYTAKDINGRKKQGKLEAADKAALVDALRAQNLFLVSCEQTDLQHSFTPLKSKELADFNRQLGTMLSAGVTLIRTIEIILRRDLKKKQRDVYETIYRELINGRALSEAMVSAQGAFPDLMINMYRAAEANGTIDLTANRMAIHYDKEYRLNNKIKSASTYPMILLCLTVAVIVLIFNTVLPNFLALYKDEELPTLTQIIVAVSKLFTDDLLYVVIGVLLLIVLISQIVRIPAVRLFVDKLKIKLPVIGKLMRTIYTARFARTLSSLYSSGLMILNALQISRNTLGNTYIAAQFDGLIKDVRNGSSLSAGLEKIDGYDKKLPSTVLIGEESGQLEQMLLSVSDSFDYEADEATTRLTAMLEPLLIIIMAVVIGTVMIGVMLPIMGMYDTIGV